MTALTMTLAWVANAVGATRRADRSDAVVGEVVTDSRTLKPGDLFVALRGPRFDGHAFVADVLNRGAVAAIVESGRVEDDGRTIEVTDTLEALQRLAQGQQRVGRYHEQQQRRDEAPEKLERNGRCGHPRQHRVAGHECHRRWSAPGPENSRLHPAALPR